MFPHNIPQDINIEALLAYILFPQGIPQDTNVEDLWPSCSLDSIKVIMKGTHKRNTYNDIVDIEEKFDGSSLISISRNSIYNALPEYLFHPIDRFSNLSGREKKDKFEEELEKQNTEKNNAYRFYAPIDLQMLRNRIMAREILRPITETNSILYDILGDRLTYNQHKNRFIKQAIPFLSSCKNIRGNKTLLTFFLRKVFMEEGLTMKMKSLRKEYRDEEPQYNDRLGDAIEDTFVGNVYDEMVTAFDIYYWPEVVDQGFSQLLDEIEEFRLFIQDYFMSVEEVLQFDIVHDDPAVRLSDDYLFNYLNFNTNL